IVLQPDHRVTWRIAWGPHGPNEKLVSVDGALFSRSTFIYDTQGHLSEKHADGPGLRGATWVWHYRTDAQGRIVERTSRLQLRNTWGSRNLPTTSVPERLEVVWANDRVTATERINNQVVRIDVYDPQDNLRSTEFRGNAGSHASLLYDR